MGLGKSTRDALDIAARARRDAEEDEAYERNEQFDQLCASLDEAER